nr:hypothetical protein [Tanacetum cinerariifolium]
GPLPPVVIREPESRKYQPLPEVPGKGKAKVFEEQVVNDLLSLQKHKKTSPVNQYIFQRRVFEPTASSFYDVSPYEVLGQSDSEDELEKIILGVEKGGQDKGQAGLDPNAQAEGQTGSNIDPGNAEARVQSTSSHVVHAGSDREHIDIDVANLSPQPSTEQLYEVFTATVYPNVQENLKLAVEEPVLLEEPTSSSGTLSSLAETKVESMVNVPIQQALSSISLITSPIIDLTSRPESPKEHQQLKATTTDTTTTTTTLPPPQAPQQSTTEVMMVKRINELEHTLADLIQVNKTIEERLDKHGARLYTLEQLDIPQQLSIVVSEVVTDAVDLAMQAPLRNRFRDLPEADMKEILHQRMWETDSYKSHEYHMQLFEALEKFRIPSDTTTTSTTSTNQDSPSTGSAAPSPAKTAATTKHQAWSTLDVTLKPLVSLTPEDLDMDEAMGLDEQAQLSDEEDIRSAHIPTVNLRQGWWKPFEEERPTTLEHAWSIRSSDVPIPTNNWASTLASNYSPPPKDSLLAQTSDITTFMDWFCKRRGITELKPQDLEGPAYEIVKVFHPDVIHLQYQIEECHKLLTDSVDDPILRHNVGKPLPLGGPPGQVTIQSDFFFNNDLEYLRYGSKGRQPALFISKMKAAYYPDAGLEQMVPYQFWIEEECKYDIAAITVRTHMRILSVVRIEVFSMYGYDYMKKIVLRRADLNEHVIAERDFKIEDSDGLGIIREVKFKKDPVLDDFESFIRSIVEEDSFSVTNLKKIGYMSVRIELVVGATILVLNHIDWSSGSMTITGGESSEFLDFVSDILILDIITKISLMNGCLTRGLSDLISREVLRYLVEKWQWKFVLKDGGECLMVWERENDELMMKTKPCGLLFILEQALSHQSSFFGSKGS